MKNLFLQLIESGIVAPSGENAQPWLFKIKEGKLFLYNNPGQDKSLYNKSQRASYIAHGAAIENMEQTANYLGYTLNINLFSKKSPHNLVAEISPEPKEKTEALNSVYYHEIYRRTTNRNPYKTDIHSNLLNDLKKNSISSNNIYFITDETQKNKISNLVTVNEKIIFQNESLHNFFYDHISWTKPEDNRKRVGFFIDTLEIPYPARISFRLFKNWKILQLLNFADIPNKIATENSKTYKKSGAFGVITVNSLDPKELIYAGRTLEKLWLDLTKRNLCLQPISGFLFLKHGLDSGEIDELISQQAENINNSYNSIKKLFKVPKYEKIVMLFRVGEPLHNPSAKSKRLPIEKFIIKNE